jgi:acetyl esterase/lipase
MAEGRVRIEEGVVFGEADGRPLLADVFHPPHLDGPAPAVLLLHGGAWRMGDRTQLRGYGLRLGREGYVCVASEYRLAPGAAWPAQIHDAKAAVRWMRGNAEDLGIDPARIAASGNSAGGHLALLLGGTAGLEEFEGVSGTPGVPADVAAVIAVYPPTRLPRVPSEITGEAGELDGDGGGDAEAAALASPVHHAAPGFPPTLLVHGAADELVPVRASFLMYEHLVAAGTSVDLHVYADQAHAFDAEPAFGRLCATEMVSFLGRYLGRRADAATPA